MPRLPTASQTALDKLGQLWPQAEIENDDENHLEPLVRTAFKGLLLSKAPAACVSSAMRVLKALGKKTGGLEASTGDTYVKHMAKRARDLAKIMDELSLETRFGLIELSTLTCIANDWDLPDAEAVDFEPLDNPRVCLDAVASMETENANCERWREIVDWLRNDPPDGDDRIERRNVAWAITWCGVVTLDDEGPLGDKEFARVLGMKGHKEFNGPRRFGVVLLGTLHKFSQRGAS